MKSTKDKTKIIIAAKNYLASLKYKYGNQYKTVNLATIHWKDFEKLVAAVFTIDINHEVFFTRGSNDHGIDAYAIEGNAKVIFQMKKYKGTIPPSVVRELYGTMIHYKAQMGILVTTSDFGPGTYDFIKNKNIRLVNGTNLLNLLRKHGYNYFYISFNDTKKNLNIKNIATNKNFKRTSSNSISSTEYNELKNIQTESSKLKKALLENLEKTNSIEKNENNYLDKKNNVDSTLITTTNNKKNRKKKIIRFVIRNSIIFIIFGCINIDLLLIYIILLFIYLINLYIKNNIK